MTRAKPKDVYGTYGCIPRKWHPAWRRVSFYAHAIAKAILERVDDFSDLSIVTDGEWQTSICRELEISGPERRNAKRAMQDLIDARLLRVEAGRVRVLLVPDEPQDVSRPCLVPCSVPRSVPLPVLDSDSTQVVENTQLTTRQLVSKQEERAAGARAREVIPMGMATPRTIPSPYGIGAAWWQKHFSQRNGSTNLQAWRQSLEWIGMQPEAERALVAKHALASMYLAGEGKRNCNPKWISGKWAEYVEGPNDFERKPPRSFRPEAELPPPGALYQELA